MDGQGGAVAGAWERHKRQVREGAQALEGLWREIGKVAEGEAGRVQQVVDEIARVKAGLADVMAVGR